jgi:hypothetical protein
MAELAIPIVVLGSLYILSEQEKKSELFTGNTLNVDDEKKKKKEPYANLDINNKLNDFNRVNHPSNNLFTQKDKNYVKEETQQVNRINLLNGQQVDSTVFKHNNMQPYFGAKIRGATNDLSITESILDNMQGTGSQIFRKSEQAPLFRPDENINYINGTPNNTDFFQSRVNESMKMSNVTLWEQQRVGPGLNLGYGSQNEKGYNTGGTKGDGGFNSGMMSRESWMPKTVDEMRVETNPRQTFDLDGHQGPATSYIKTQGSIGKVEKHLPEKYYDSGPNRWFTTTGVEHNPPIRSDLVIPMENRIDTTTEYYGAGGNSAQTTYTNSEVEDSKRQNLGQLPFSNATATSKFDPSPNDHGVQSYKILPNNRTTDRDSKSLGGVYGMAKAVMAPLMDVFKPTRKENVIGNLRQTGNVNGLTPTGHLFNNNDKTKVTNREMTTGKINLNYLNVQGQNNAGNAYQVTQHKFEGNQRDTTNQQYIGNGSKQGSGLRPYNAEYAQQNNVNKTYESRTNQGNMNLFNNHNNIEINRNDNLLENNRTYVPNGGPSIIPSTQFMGEINGIQTYDHNYNASRMDDSLLSAFKNNPYTKSLNSVA